MKKLFLVWMLLAFFGVSQVHAQKWLKVLGKAAESVLNQAASGSSSAAGGSVTCTLPDFSVKLESCKRYGTNVVMEVVFSNNSNRDMSIDTSGKTTVIDNNGESCWLDGNSSPIVGEDTWGQFSAITFLKDVPVKGKLVIRKVPENATSFRIVKMEFGNNYYIQFRNIPIANGNE